MKKIVALFLCFLAILSVVGCAEDTKDIDSTVQTDDVATVEYDVPETLENANITFISHFDPGTKDATTPLYRAMKAYESKYGKNTINVIISSSDVYKDKIVALIASKESPEIVQVSTDWMPTFAAENILQPIDEFFDISKLPYQGMVQTCTWDNKHYVANPNGVWSKVLWYNKSLFEENGVKTPKEYYDENNWCWDTFLTCAQEMTSDTTWGFSALEPDVFVKATDTGTFVELSSGTNPKIVWDNADVNEAIQFTSDLINKYKVWLYDLGYAKLNFKKRKVAMVPNSIGFKEEYCKGLDDEIDCVPVPKKNPTTEYTMTGFGLFYGIGADCRNIEGAKAFLKILQTEEAIDIKANKKTPYERSITDEQVELCRKISNNAKVYSERNFPTWASINHYLFWNAICIDGMPVSTAKATYAPLLKNAIEATISK